MSARAQRAAWIALWTVLAVPAIYQLVLLATAIGGRFSYPYDLEWMEGGLLHHAQRISDGQGIYVAPSVDFIPYLYTPLYPGLVAFFGGAFGIDYQLGRALSILALVAIGIVAFASIARRRRADEDGLPPAAALADGARPGLLARGHTWLSAALRGDDATTGVARGPRWVGAALALGVFAAGYPYVEGWYDLVRADTLFLFLATAGIYACARWAQAGVAGNGDARMMAAATILALAFFTKQTGVLYVAWGGVIIAARWAPDLRTRGGVLGALRRLAVYGATAGAIGFGGVILLDRQTGGWFWTYAFRLHQEHDFSMDRFWSSFGNVLWHYPALSIAIAVTLVAVIATAIARPGPTSRLPEAAGPFLLWTATYALSTVVGALGWGTEFAHFNAYMPALLHGALAAGAAVPALAGCARAWAGERRGATVYAAAAAAAVAITAGITLIQHRWDPTKLVPTGRDRKAGDALIAHVKQVEGDVWIPSHPWYAHLAGKRMFVHRMGIKDVTARKPRVVRGLDAALREHLWAALVLDAPRDVDVEVALVPSTYRTDAALPGAERPRTFTGARVAPATIWVPAVKEKPPFGTRVLFDFESGQYDGWTAGGGWRTRPVMRAVTGQQVVGGFGGRFFATSMNGGDKASGNLTSDPFVIEGSRISLRVGGGVSDRLRVELRVEGRVMRIAQPVMPVAERLTEVTWDVGDLRGQRAVIVAVDDDEKPSGHLNLDEIWLWP